MNGTVLKVIGEIGDERNCGDLSGVRSKYLAQLSLRIGGRVQEQDIEEANRERNSMKNE